MTPEKYQVDLEELLYYLHLSEETTQKFQCIQANTKERAMRIIWESHHQMKLIDRFFQTESYYLLDPAERKMLEKKYIEIEIHLYENTKQ